MAFNAEIFKNLFQTEADWRAFYQMVYNDEMERLKAAEDFLDGEKRGLKLIFRRINDHRYEAMGKRPRHLRSLLSLKNNHVNLLSVPSATSAITIDGLRESTKTEN